MRSNCIFAIFSPFILCFSSLYSRGIFFLIETRIFLYFDSLLFEAKLSTAVIWCVQRRVSFIRNENHSGAFRYFYFYFYVSSLILPIYFSHLKRKWNAIAKVHRFAIIYRYYRYWFITKFVTGSLPIDDYKLIGYQRKYGLCYMRF